MAIIEINEVSSRAGGRGDAGVGMRGKNQPLRFLKTLSCPTVDCHALQAIDCAMDEAAVQSFSNKQSRTVVLIAKIASRLRFMRSLERGSRSPVFVSFMGFSEYKTFPFCYRNEIIPLCFDCWPNFYERWTSFFKRHRVRLAFFTARQSAQYFANTLPKMKSVWMPEATNPFDYDPSTPWSERETDVLELGRKNDLFHSRITDPLATARRPHLFEKVKGQIIFPDRPGLIRGLSQSKISICFPSSQTHPERSGTVETVTLRYFESIASKCVLLGHAPQELIDLFGYNPVIEVDTGSEYEQLKSILSDPDSARVLVEKNYQRLLEVGTWKCRIKEALAVLRDLHVSI